MLEKILKDMIANAKAHPTRAQIRKLNNGLFVTIIWNEPLFTMTLSRETVRPGPQEMKTCIRLLPDTVDRPPFADVITTNFNSRPSLRVDFPAAELVQTTFE